MPLSCRKFCKRGRVRHLAYTTVACDVPGQGISKIDANANRFVTRFGKTILLSVPYEIHPERRMRHPAQPGIGVRDLIELLAIPQVQKGPSASNLPNPTTK